jgi:hypothetical protein
MLGNANGCCRQAYLSRKGLQVPFGRAELVAAALTLLVGATVEAQTLPSGPISLAGGSVTVGGDVSATIGPTDPGFFNYTDYDRSTLRLLQVDVSGSAKAGDHLTVLGQVRTQNANTPQLFALYLRIRPWVKRPFDIQVGRVPPTFGAFPRRAYGVDNVLIGYPLAYQYLTSLRPDSVPANADELLRMRGRGWRSSFSVGNPEAGHGDPVASAFRWGTGLQASTTTERFDVAAAATTGTLSHPDRSLSSGLTQVTGRIAARPTAGLVVGVSASRGRYLTDGAAARLPPALDRNDYTQRAIGADVEYSRGYYLVRMEMVAGRWIMPELGVPRLDESLSAMGVSIEGRYRIYPGLFVAARFDHLGFSEITGTSRRAEWDAPVSRIELGGGYSLQRNLQLRASWQHNTRPNTRVAVLNLGVVQLLFWF